MTLASPWTASTTARKRVAFSSGDHEALGAVVDEMASQPLRFVRIERSVRAERRDHSGDYASEPRHYSSSRVGTGPEV